MNDNRQREPHGGLNLGDIYFVLFRHKWKIILLAAAGLLSAAALWVLHPPPYQSEAKLFIRYVLEGRSLSPAGNETKMKSPDERGENIINSEVEILTSLDLAKRVVEVVGADRILAKIGGIKDTNRAAILVRNNLLVEAPKKSSVITIIFKHPDPAVVQEVLLHVIDAYTEKHIRIHQTAGVLDSAFDGKIDDLKHRLAQNEIELRKIISDTKVISIDDARKSYADEAEKIRQEIMADQVELAGRQAALDAMAPYGSGAKPAAGTNAESGPVAPEADAAAYERTCKHLAAIWEKVAEDRKHYTEESKPVKESLVEIANTEALKKKLEDQYPSLKLSARQLYSAPSSGQPGAGSFDLPTELARLAALPKRIQVLSNQWESIRSDITNMDQLAPRIQDLERSRKIEEDNYRFYQTKKEQANIDDAEGGGKITGIGRVEEPTPPYRDRAKSDKVAGMLAAGGILGGLALAFLVELYLDPTVKRAKDIEVKLGLPLFLNVPDINWNGHRRLAKVAANGRPRLNGAAGDTPATSGLEAPQPNGALEIAPWDAHHSLRPFYEALRDKLIGFFEARNLNHKPKLVAVTSAGKGPGATTIAIGLAAALSETGDGNVLLVDMNLEHGAVQQFQGGKPACGLDDALENGTRDTALVQSNLYVVSGSLTNGDQLPRVLPKRFASLLPKLKASDYDYVIFDMPPVSQTSVTLRLSGYMDMVLLVAESEKTDCEVLKRASSQLLESSANVGVVLNKTRRYVPARLHQEL